MKRGKIRKNLIVLRRFDLHCCECIGFEIMQNIDCLYMVLCHVGRRCLVGYAVLHLCLTSKNLFSEVLQFLKVNSMLDIIEYIAHFEHF